MYTIENIFKMYNNKNQEIYKGKVEEYVEKYSDTFKDDDHSMSVIVQDSEIMNSILDSLHEGNIYEALESTYGLDTFVREYLAEILIEQKKADSKVVGG